MLNIISLNPEFLNVIAIFMLQCFNNPLFKTYLSQDDINQQITLPMTPKKNQRLVEGLRQRDHGTIEYLYKNIFPMILDLVSSNNGSYQDAEDIFQECLLIILEKIRDNSLDLNCKFTTYFWEICHRLWLKELRKRRRNEIDLENIFDQFDQISYDNFIEERQVKLVIKNLKNLSPNCQKILFLHFDRKSIEDIMSIMGFSSKQICQDKKFRCKKRLIELVLRDPEYNKLQNELLIID